MDRIPKQKANKFEARRCELAEATLKTLSEMGYARTSLREIAQNSSFTHGVLHYYFADKVDLIVCSVRQYKGRCVTRYDRIIATSTSFEELEERFLDSLAETLSQEAHMHRLWYDLRSQALFDDAFRADVAEIDDSLKNMIARVTARGRKLARAAQVFSDADAYAMYDGLFQHYLFRHLAGDTRAVGQMRDGARGLLRLVMGVDAASMVAA